MVQGGLRSVRHRFLARLYGCAALFYAVVVLPVAYPVKAYGEPTEYSVKGAFLFNFAKYAAWDSPPPRRTSGRFVICLWKNDPFGTSLQELGNRQLDGLKVQVQLVSKPQEVLSCDVLFLSQRDSPDLDGLHGVVVEGHVLLVTEEPLAGAINFQLIDGQVKFDCNLLAAAQSGIKLSSQLVKLAQRVHEE